MAANWANTLAFLASDDPAAANYLESADLSNLNRSFSLSTYLSPGGVHQVAPATITHKGVSIDGSLLSCLALGEECRKLGKAVVFHLPARNDSNIGHAADIVFIMKCWTDQMKNDWDNSDWSKRLELMKIDETTYGKQSICSHICSHAGVPHMLT